MVTLTTHQHIDTELCGEAVETRDGYSRVHFTTTDRMTVDEMGLVHGGFLFGCADYAAMIAVNHPHVVLASANVKFLKPVRVGDTVEAEAYVDDVSDTKKTVSVSVKCDDTIVFAGEFICVILDSHVLDR